MSIISEDENNEHIVAAKDKNDVVAAEDENDIVAVEDKNEEYVVNVVAKHIIDIASLEQ